MFLGCIVLFLCLVHVMSFPTMNVLYFYISIFWIIIIIIIIIG